MKHIDALTLEGFVREIREVIVASQLQKIFQPTEKEFILRFRLLGRNFFLFISLNPSEVRIHPIPHKFSHSIEPSPFCMSLRKHLEDAKLQNIDITPTDRIIHFTFLRGSNKKILMLELFNKHPNMFILDEQGRYLNYYKATDPQRDIKIGAQYTLPPSATSKNWEEFIQQIFTYIEEKGKVSKKEMLKKFTAFHKESMEEILFLSGVEEYITTKDLENIKKSWTEFFKRWNKGDILPHIHYNTLEKPSSWTFWKYHIQGSNMKKFFSISELLQEFYFPYTISESLNKEKKRLSKLISKRLKKLQKRLKKQEQDMKNTKDAEKYKIWGELLLTYSSTIQKGNTNVELENYYETPPSKIKIHLDPSLSPKENAFKYLKKYKKAKRGYEIVKERMKQTQEEMEILENLLQDVEMVEKMEELEEIYPLLQDMKIEVPPPSPKKHNKPTPPLTFELDKGYVVVVGKNSKQNEKVTFNIASKEDLWFHARGIPGSHTILKIQKPSQPVPEKIIYQTASIAAFYSKGKNSTKVPVDYTKVKYVRKIKGKIKGKVTYSNEKTIMVKPKTPNSPFFPQPPF